MLDKFLQHPSNTCHVFIEALRKAGPNHNDLVERLVKRDSEATFQCESQVSSDERLIGELIRYLRFCTGIGNSINNKVEGNLEDRWATFSDSCGFYYYHWVDISAGALFCPEDIIHPVVMGSTLTCIIYY